MTKTVRFMNVQGNYQWKSRNKKQIPSLSAVLHKVHISIGHCIIQIPMIISVVRTVSSLAYHLYLTQFAQSMCSWRVSTFFLREQSKTRVQERKKKLNEQKAKKKKNTKKQQNWRRSCAQDVLSHSLRLSRMVFFFFLRIRNFTFNICINY